MNRCVAEVVKRVENWGAWILVPECIRVNNFDNYRRSTGGVIWVFGENKSCWKSIDVCLGVVAHGDDGWMMYLVVVGCCL